MLDSVVDALVILSDPSRIAFVVLGTTIGLMIGIIIIGNHYAGTEKIWPAFSIALLPLFYGYFIKLVVVGLKKIDDD